jgi:hypothetical protein
VWGLFGKALKSCNDAMHVIFNCCLKIVSAVDSAENVGRWPEYVCPANAHSIKYIGVGRRFRVVSIAGALMP